MFIVSDKTEDLMDQNIVLDVFTWDNGFSPIYTFMREIDVFALSATDESVMIQSDLK